MSQRTLYGWAAVGLLAYVLGAALAALGGVFALFSSYDGHGFRGYGNSIAAACIVGGYLLAALVIGLVWLRSASRRRQGFALGVLVGLAITALLVLERVVSY